VLGLFEAARGVAELLEGECQPFLDLQPPCQCALELAQNALKREKCEMRVNS
jgi:hypothetical protein